MGSEAQPLTTASSSPTPNPTDKVSVFAMLNVCFVLWCIVWYSAMAFAKRFPAPNLSSCVCLFADYEFRKCIGRLIHSNGVPAGSSTGKFTRPRRWPSVSVPYGQAPHTLSGPLRRCASCALVGSPHIIPCNPACRYDSTFISLLCLFAPQSTPPPPSPLPSAPAAPKAPPLPAGSNRVAPVSTNGALSATDPTSVALPSTASAPILSPPANPIAPSSPSLPALSSAMPSQLHAGYATQVQPASTVSTSPPQVKPLQGKHSRLRGRIMIVPTL